MAKIRQDTGRKDELSGYGRVFGDIELGKLFSQVQACVISAGTELEKILIRKSPYAMPFDEFEQHRLAHRPFQQSVLLLYKLPRIDNKQGDFLIVLPSERRAIIIEIKEGDMFDTKKSDGEKESLAFLAQHYTNHLGMNVSYALSSFYVSTRGQITIGTKHRFDHDHALTGRELCAMIGVNYEDVVAERRADEEYNLDYFLDRLLEMPDIRQRIEAKLAGRILRK